MSKKGVMYSATGTAYIPPKLVESTDKKSGWYILYYVTDLSTDKLVRKRFYKIEGESVAEKRRNARKHMVRISQSLAKGATIGKDPTPKEKSLNILEVYKTAEQIRRREAEQDGRSPHYLHRARVFHEWLVHAKLDKKRVSDRFLKREDVYAFMDYLTEVREVGARTKNNYLDYVKMASNVLIDRGYVTTNPAKGIRRYKTQGKRHVPFTPEQKEILDTWMLQNDPGLYNFTRMIYYGFIRRIEILRLKVGQVDLENSIILIWTGNSKNQRQMPVVIPPDLYGMLERILSARPPASYFLFGTNLEPSPKSLHPNRVSERHRAALEACEIDTSIHDLYGWKHTGVCAAYRAGVDIYSIMRQCRHSNLNETENYMRSMGLRISSELKTTKW